MFGECIVLLGCLAMQTVRVRGARPRGGGAARRARGGRGGACGSAPLEITRRISVARPPRRPSAGAARAARTPHYPLTIRNRPTSWLLDLGYNDLTSAK